jgi:hypothetical protein
MIQAGFTRGRRPDNLSATQGCSMIGRAALFVPLLLAALSAGEALAQEDTAPARGPEAYLFSARGPAPGEAVSGGGLRLVLLDFSYLRGISEELSVDFRFSTIAFISLVEFGARYRLVDTGAFALALRGGGFVAPMWAPGGGEIATAISARLNPGVIATLGRGRVKTSLGLEVPVSFIEGGVGSSGTEALSVRSPGLSAGLSPSVAVEIPLKKRSFYIQAQAMALLVGKNGSLSNALPLLAFGLSR